MQPLVHLSSPYFFLVFLLLPAPLPPSLPFSGSSRIGAVDREKGREEIQHSVSRNDRFQGDSQSQHVFVPRYSSNTSPSLAPPPHLFSSSPSELSLSSECSPSAGPHLASLLGNISSLLCLRLPFFWAKSP